MPRKKQISDSAPFGQSLLSLVDGAALAELVSSGQRYTFDNANFAIPTNATLIQQVGTLTSHRTIALPTPGGVAIGKKIEVVNLGQRYFGCLDLILAPGSGNSINGLSNGSTYFFPWGCERVTLTRTDAGVTGYHWLAIPDLPGGAGNGSLIHDPRFLSSSAQANASWSSEIYGANNSGAGSSQQSSTAQGAIVVLNSGTTSTGRAGYRTSNVIRFAGTSFSALAARFRLAIPQASDETNDFLVVAGLGATQGGTATDNGIFWRYRHSINNGNLQAFSGNGTNLTTLESNISPVGSNYIDVAFYVNRAGTEITFFNEGTSLGVITTNIPTAALGVDFRIQKIAGTTARNAHFSKAAYFYPGHQTA